MTNYELEALKAEVAALRAEMASRPTTRRPYSPLEEAFIIAASNFGVRNEDIQKLTPGRTLSSVRTKVSELRAAGLAKAPAASERLASQRGHRTYRGPKVRWTDAMRKRLKSLANAGESIDDICEEMGLRRKQVERQLYNVFTDAEVRAYREATR